MKILIIRYKKSGKVLEGGEQCSSKNHSCLSQIAGPENVETYYIHDETRRRSLMEYLKGAWYFPQGYFFGLTPSRIKEIISRAQSFDVVFIDRSIFGILALKLKQSGYKGRIIGFYHNVEVLYFNAKLSPTYPMRNLVLGCVNKNDRWTSQYCDRIIALNSRDDSEIFNRYNRHADQLVPIAFSDSYKLERYTSELTSSKPLCMFLGAYFPANVEGIEWFVRNVKPHVDIRMQIVGKGMEKIRNESWITSDIEVVANAPDLRPLFEQADIMVLPIFKGSGMKVKTCESLMYGKNIVATPEAWEGYELDCSKAGGNCETAQQFIDCINGFSVNPRPRFNAYSRHVFLEKYSEESVVDKFRSVLFD